MLEPSVTDWPFTWVVTVMAVTVRSAAKVRVVFVPTGWPGAAARRESRPSRPVWVVRVP